jgi:hypothetical protein
MSPIVRKGLDVVIAVALTAAVAFVIVISNSFLVGRASWHGFNIWYAFILRPDILGTMILTALVTVAYHVWAQGGRPRG